VAVSRSRHQYININKSIIQCVMLLFPWHTLAYLRCAVNGIRSRALLEYPVDEIPPLTTWANQRCHGGRNPSCRCDFALAKSVRQHNLRCVLAGETMSLIICQHNPYLCGVPRCAIILESRTFCWHHHADRGDHLVLTRERTPLLRLYISDRLSAPSLCFLA